MIIVITKKGFVYKFKDIENMPETIRLNPTDEVVSAVYVY